MSDRALCRLFSFALWLVTAFGWGMFVYLFRTGGPLYPAPTESKVLWWIVLFGLTCVASWGTMPDKRRRTW